MEREFTKEMIIESLNDEEIFDQAKEFLISGSINQYPFTEEEKNRLSEVTNPEEFALMFIGINIGKWFLLTRGE